MHIYVVKYVSIFISNLRINYVVYVKWIDNIWYNNLLLLLPNCYEVVVRCSWKNSPLWFMLGPHKLSLQVTIGYHVIMNYSCHYTLKTLVKQHSITTMSYCVQNF